MLGGRALGAMRSSHGCSCVPCTATAASRQTIPRRGLLGQRRGRCGCCRHPRRCEGGGCKRSVRFGVAARCCDAAWCGCVARHVAVVARGRRLLMASTSTPTTRPLSHVAVVARGRRRLLMASTSGRRHHPPPSPLQMTRLRALLCTRSWGLQYPLPAAALL